MEEITHLIETIIYETIKHGDAEHKRWLKQKSTDVANALTRHLEDYFASQKPRPISEAPKEGTHILGFVQSSVYGTNWWVVMRWRQINEGEELYGWFATIGDGKQQADSCTSSPTHFLPLSALPTPEEG